MKEIDKLLSCGICGRELTYSKYSEAYKCKKHNTLVMLYNKNYYRGCLVCMSGIMVMPTNRINISDLCLCLNPDCPTYSIDKDKQQYHIIYDKIRLSTFTIKRIKRVNFVYNRYGSIMFINLMRKVAKNYLENTLERS